MENDNLFKETRNFAYKECSIIYGLKRKNKNNKINELNIILLSCCSTLSAIIDLSSKYEYFYLEMIMLSRAFIEKIINFCYLMICEENEYKMYFQYTTQKSIRRLNRKIKIGDKELIIKLNNIEKLKLNDNLKESLEAFTSKNGKEISRWTNRSIEDRLKIISEKSKVNINIFMINLYHIYENASEALHGTIYGCTFHTGIFDPTIDKKDLVKIYKNLNDNAAFLLLELGSMFHEVIVLLNEFDDFSLELKNSNFEKDMIFEIVENRNK